ncbi:MAG: ABC transporter ATP-binding protein, partial [Clostridia bacterium]|nr:ABC transporter ATP-binding protein [Clostridia bacterium]
LLLGFTQFFTGVITILGTLIFMVYIHPGIAILVVVLTPLSLFVAKFITSRTHHLFQKQARVRGEQTAMIDEMVGGARIVRAFSKEKSVAEHFDAINDSYTDISLRAIFISSISNPSTRFVNNVIYALTCLFGALLVAGGKTILGGGMTVGALSGLLAYTTQYTKPFNEISGVVTELQNSLTCASRVIEFLNTPAEKADDADAAVLDVASGKVEMESVFFSYTPEQRLIRDFSLDVAPGERIAIVGPTGCGKTTLINLLMRFYDPVDGRILVDGHDITEVTRHSLRKNYGMVLQETWLFAGTVKENIAVGRPEATEEEIVAAAKAAHAHSFIKRLPGGYDAPITENGANLSAGQRQLLCIARVMLTAPPMLILDEATSSIDTRTEIRIQKAFDEMMKGKTSFVVAHRLSTVRDADKILVMKDGNIIEQGKHEELLAKGGFYATLYNSQFEQA